MSIELNLTEKIFMKKNLKKVEQKDIVKMMLMII